jgi:chromosome segregation ATPase
MSKIYEAIKQAEQQRASQRDVVTEIVSRLAAEEDALDVALGECRAQLAELRDRLEKFEAENGTANQRIDRTAESFASAIGTLRGRLDDVGHQLEAGVQKTHEDVGNLQGLVNTTIEDWNKRLAALVDEVRSRLEGNAPAVEELRHGVARLRQLQAQSSDELHALIETARLLAGDATQRIDALGGRLQTQDELLRSLEKAHVAFEAVLSASQSQVHDLAEQSHASAIEQEKLRNGLRDSNEDIAAQLRRVAIDNEHRFQDIRQEIATFRQSVASTTSTLRASLDEHHGHTETVFQRLTTRIASGEQQAAEQLRNILELAAQLSGWSSAQERASESAESLRADLESVRAKAAESTANIGALEQKITELRATVAAAQDTAADQVQKALEPLAAQLSSWSSAQEHGTESAERLRADLESVRAKAAESTANIGALEKKIAELRATVAAAQDTAADQVQKALEPLTTQLSTWSSAQEHGAESAERLRAALESVRAKATESTANIGALEQQMAELRAAVAAAQDNAADQLKKALEPLSSWSAAQEHGIDGVETLRTELESVRANAAESKAIFGTLEQQMAELRATVAAAQDTAADQLKKAMEPLAAQLSSWSSAHERGAESAERLRSNVESLHANAAESQTAIWALEQQIDELRATVAAAQDTAADQLKKAMEPLAAQLSSWSSARERGAESAERLRSDVESLSANAAESQTAMWVLEKQIAELRTTVTAAQDNAGDQLKKALEPVAAQLSTLSSAREQGIDAVEALRADVESLRAKTTESTTNIGTLKQEITELRTAIPAARKYAAEQVETALEPLAVQLSTWSSAQARSGESIESLRADLENLRAKAEEASANVGALEQEIAELRAAAAVRQVAEAMQHHRTSLANGAGGQPEPLRSALRETAGKGRIEREIIPAASVQSLEPATSSLSDLERHSDPKGSGPAELTPTAGPGLREQGERGAGHWAAIFKEDRWRRAMGVAALVCCVLFGATVLSRLMSAEKRNSDRADFGGEAKSATLRDPRVEPRFASGLNALRHGDFASAEKTFREVVAICPNCVAARNNLAVALDEEQKREAAVEQLREALSIQPDYRRARENLERLQGGIGAPSADPEGLEGYADR